MTQEIHESSHKKLPRKISGGFTVIELIVVIVLIGFASILFFSQKQTVESIARDNMKKTSINAMYYGLEKVFYAENKYYPQTVTSENLISVDPSLFTDPSGNKINTAESDYTYTPTECKNNKCKSYTLTASLENEADFVKTNKN